MDALALLCTLHADGPATLVRLRAADFATLEDVIRAEPEALATLLRSSKLAATRFQKEATHLRERVVVEMPVAVGARTPAAERRPARRVPSATSPLVERAPGAAEAPIPANTSPLERVLAAWRDADEEEPAPLAPAPDSRTGIAVASIDGMDASTSATLAGAGVRDLARLATSDPLALSRATNLSYSKVTRLCALARRAAPLAPAPRERTVEERFSPSERPTAPAEPLVRLERDFVLDPVATEEGAGGPFA